MRPSSILLLVIALPQLGCGKVRERSLPRGSEFCLAIQQAQDEALDTLRFVGPVDVARVDYCWCPEASIALADAKGATEFFVLSWPFFRFEEATLRYSTASPTAKGHANDDELVEAAILLMGTWVAKSFSLDDIARFSTTPDPPGCDPSEPEVTARMLFRLASQPRYARLVLPVVCTAEDSPQATTTDPPTESTRIYVKNLAVAVPTTRAPGHLLDFFLEWSNPCVLPGLTKKGLVPRGAAAQASVELNPSGSGEGWVFNRCQAFASVPGQTIPTIFKKSSGSSDLGSYIRKDEHGYGSRCQPWWLYLDRRPCSLAIRAV